jgi:mono/diheme cytochrome c family protein/glucose/arabinose dehydrogenase
MKKVLLNSSVALLSLLAFGSCQENYEEPEVSLESYQIEQGFELQVVASEPFLEAPVSIDFDNKGRIWVAEMRGYMTNIDGDGENLPSGTISIMEDLDGDGVTDHSKIFLDGLVLPRALAHVYDGLLYAEPPMLWFVEINDDKPGKKVLVDSLYADDGNVEHQPNGLMMNMDNWIYNAKSHFRYQRKNGVWIKEPTSYRGQWGITKDNFGRLYYNNNSTLLQGDYVLPNTVINNPYYTPEKSISKTLTTNQRVYPLHVTSVNRGYEKGVLDQDSMLVNATSACGPMVYRAGQFTDDYNENVFVCTPEVNLIKRHVLDFSSIQTTGEAAWVDKEFLASTDEAFRPVNLFNGPDGAMYVVDMHRGVIQHGAYMSPYLRKHLEEKGLDKVIGMGRILRVKNSAQPLQKIPDLGKATNTKLIDLLNDKNGWVRDKAQQLLILNGTAKDQFSLNEVALDADQPIAQMHALHTLNGLDLLSFELLMKVAETSSPEVVAHALLLIPTPKSEDQVTDLLSLSMALKSQNNATIDLYLLMELGKWVETSESFIPHLKEISERRTDPIYQEAALSSLAGQESKVLDSNPDTELVSMLVKAEANRAANAKNWIYELASLPEDDRTRGLRFYKNICGACHGPGGDGIEGLAPPLRNSEYITASSKRLALILLHGLKGPINVNGKHYEFNGEMPGIANNPDMSDQDITDLMIYLSNAFGKSTREIDADQVKALRAVKSKTGGAYTEEELLKIKN